MFILDIVQLEGKESQDQELLRESGHQLDVQEHPRGLEHRQLKPDVRRQSDEAFHVVLRANIGEVLVQVAEEIDRLHQITDEVREDVTVHHRLEQIEIIEYSHPIIITVDYLCLHHSTIKSTHQVDTNPIQPSAIQN